MPSSAESRVSHPAPPRPVVAERHSLWPLVLLLAATVLLIPLDRELFGIPLLARLGVGGGCALLFGVLLFREPQARRRIYLALAAPLALLALAPINTDTSTRHLLTLGIAFALVLLIPLVILRRQGIITYRFWPKRLDWLDVAYTLLAIPLAWFAFGLYFSVLSPSVPFNWALPPEPRIGELLRLFLGINAVGIWDELFFINTCYALIRALFPYRFANPAQAVIYTTVLYDMAFSGWGPLFVYLLALTQGAMYERAKVLLWVLLVHLIVDYFLFQAIVSATYPGLEVWWH